MNTTDWLGSIGVFLILLALSVRERGGAGSLAPRTTQGKIDANEWSSAALFYCVFVMKEAIEEMMLISR